MGKSVELRAVPLVRSERESSADVTMLSTPFPDAQSDESGPVAFRRICCS